MSGIAGGSEKLSEGVKKNLDCTVYEAFIGCLHYQFEQR